MRSHQRQGLPSLQLQTPSGCLKSAGEISDNIGYFISRHGETRNASIYEVSLICIETCPAPTRLAEITIRFDVITYSHRNLNCVYHFLEPLCQEKALHNGLIAIECEALFVKSIPGLESRGSLIALAYRHIWQIILSCS